MLQFSLYFQNINQLGPFFIMLYMLNVLVAHMQASTINFKDQIDATPFLSHCTTFSFS